MEAKPRPLRVPIHILAYFGDYMTQFEESVKRIATQVAETKKMEKYKDPKTQSSGAQSLGGQG